MFGLSRNEKRANAAYIGRAIKEATDEAIRRADEADERRIRDYAGWLVLAANADERAAIRDELAAIKERRRKRAYGESEGSGR